MPLDALVHHDVYNDPSDAEVLRAYAERERKGMERYRSVPELRELIEKSGVSNLAQVYTTVKYTRESHLEYSETVLGSLRARGYFGVDRPRRIVSPTASAAT